MYPSKTLHLQSFLCIDTESNWHALQDFPFYFHLPQKNCGCNVALPGLLIFYLSQVQFNTSENGRNDSNLGSLFICRFWRHQASWLRAHLVWKRTSSSRNPHCLMHQVVAAAHGDCHVHEGHSPSTSWYDQGFKCVNFITCINYQK